VNSFTPDAVVGHTRRAFNGFLEPLEFTAHLVNCGLEPVPHLTPPL